MTATTFPALFFLLLLPNIVIYACEQDVYNEGNTAYAEGIQHMINSIYKKLNSDGAASYLDVMDKSFEKAFDGSTCGTYRRTNVSGEDVVSRNQNLAAFLKDYTFNGTKISAQVLGAVESTQSMLRKLLRLGDFSSCFLTKLRDVILEEILTCANQFGPPQIQIDTSKLKPVPLPPREMFGDRVDGPATQFERNLYALVNIFAQGYLQIADCELRKGEEASTALIEDLTRLLARDSRLKLKIPGIDEPVNNVCEIAEKTLSSCLCRYHEQCPTAMNCLTDIIEDFGDRNSAVFSPIKVSVWGIRCKGALDTSSSSSDSGESVGEVFKLLIRDGKELFDTLKKLAGKNPGKANQLGAVVKSVLKANFQTDAACGCGVAPEILAVQSGCPTLKDRLKNEPPIASQ